MTHTLSLAALLLSVPAAAQTPAGPAAAQTPAGPAAAQTPAGPLAVDAARGFGLTETELGPLALGPGMAAVIPTTRSSTLAISMSVSGKTSWKRGGGAGVPAAGGWAVFSVVDTGFSGCSRWGRGVDRYAQEWYRIQPTTRV